MIEEDARKVVEAVLFSSPDVLSAENLAKIVGNTTPGHIRLLVEGLNLDYERGERTFRIVPVAGGFQMRTLPVYRDWIRKSEPLKPVRLTQPALETLAIVAYRQPVTRAEVEQLRGVDCSSGLRTLLERKLIRIVGKDKSPGRPILYGTTREFLSLFNLTDLRDLPTLEELDLPPPLEAAEEARPDEAHRPVAAAAEGDGRAVEAEPALPPAADDAGASADPEGPAPAPEEPAPAAPRDAG